MKIGAYSLRAENGLITVFKRDNYESYDLYHITKSDVVYYIACLENPDSKLLTYTVPMRWTSISYAPSEVHTIDPIKRYLGCTRVPLEIAKEILTQL